MSKNTFRIDLDLVTRENADEQQKPILERAKKANGMIPNMYNNMVNLAGLQDAYDTGYAHFRKEAGFTPAGQEVIFVTVSIANSCGHCIAAHRFLDDNVSKTPIEVTNAIRKGKEIPDAKLKALSKFTRIMFDSPGNPTPEEAKAFLGTGYSQKNILGIILALSVKTISNYANHIFHTEIDEAFSCRILKKA